MGPLPFQRRCLFSVSLFLLLAIAFATEEGYVVLDRETGSLTMHEGEPSTEDTGTGGSGMSPPSGAIVHGSFADTIETKGVGQLRVRTIATAHDDQLFEALGYAEGSLTAHRVVQHMFNSNQKAAPPAVLSFLSQNEAYLRDSVQRFGLSDPYWRVVGLFLARQKGFLAGLHRRMQRLPTISLVAFDDVSFSQLDAYKQRLLREPDYLASENSRLNLQCDTDEVVDALEYTSAREHLPNFLSEHSGGLQTPDADGSLTVAAERTARKNRRHVRGHCSALIKVAGPRLLMAHATWADFNEMLRVFKEVEFRHVSEPALASRHIAYTTYPGFYASTDDWIILKDQNLHVMETTLTVYNMERLGKFVTHRSVMTPLRSMVASLLADSPRSWYETFSRENSGTQNNQWMIVDTEAWSKPNAKSTGVLWVLEQMPGLILAKDQTQKLLDDGYWASYNTPFYEETKRASLTTSMFFEGAAALGSVCNCENQRGMLFKEMQEHVDTIAKMQSLLASNTWRTNRNSWRCPKCSIAARYDIQGQNWTIGREFSDQSAERNCGASDLFGAIDAKVADDTMIAQGAMHFVSGPPRLGVPAFDWRTSPLHLTTGKPHVGHPRGVWAFPWQRLGSRTLLPEESVVIELERGFLKFV